MTLEDALDILLPGLPERNCPSFTGISGIAALAARDNGFVARLQQWVRDLPVSEQMSEDALIRSFEVNDFRAIRDAILEIYFSHPAVVKAVRGTSGPLFPTGADVEHIDFDMLRPVFERGEVFRKMT